MLVRPYKTLLLVVILTFSSILSASEAGKKKTICLNMIVKNEHEIITRCLQSVLPIIDTWVIVDTGSTDGTQKIIKEFLKEIPGELYERPWVNFGYNRQEALLLAKKKADYILFMDADDVLNFSEDFKIPDLTKDFYAIPAYCKDGQVYWFPRLIKADLEWFWEGVVHEDLLCKNSTQGVALEGAKYVYIHDGARSKDPNTYKRDIELLEEAIKKDPNNPRNFFYLARSFLNAKMPERALEAFEKRAQMQGSEQEIFESKMMIGRIKHALDFDGKVVEDSFFKAYLSRPHRAEPLYYLSIKLCERGEYEKSYQILRLALELPSEITDYMLLEKWVYDYGLLCQLINCAKNTGRYQEGIAACDQLLKKPGLPENIKTQVEANFEALHQMNIKQMQEKVKKILE